MEHGACTSITNTWGRKPEDQAASPEVLTQLDAVISEEELVKRLKARVY